MNQELGPLQFKVLTLLYEEWFRYGNLQPQAMWVVKFSPEQKQNEILKPGPYAELVYFAEKIGLHKKSLSDWQRFYTLHYSQPWNVSELKHQLPLINSSVYEIGVCWYAIDAQQRLEVAMYFGPKYGRGYLFDAGGTVLSSWVS